MRETQQGPGSGFIFLTSEVAIEERCFCRRPVDRFMYCSANCIL